MHPVFQHPVAGKATRLNVLKNPFHLGLCFRRDDPWARDIFAKFSRVGNRVVHVRDATLIDEIDNQLHLVQTLKIGHFRRIASFNKCLVTCLDQFDKTATQDSLLTEEIRLTLFLKRCFDDTRTSTTNSRGVRQANIMGIARCVLMHCKQAWHAAAANIFGPDGVARSLWRDHKDVNIAAWLNQVEMHIQTMGKGNGSPGAHVLDDVGVIDISLQFIRRQHHDHIAPFGRIRNIHDLKSGIAGLAAAARVSAKRNSHIGNATVLQIGRMGMALAAITDNHNLLVLDQADIGIAIIIHTH